jgi:TPR repeat protein
MDENPTTAQEQYELGLMYYGVQDYDKAIYWYTKAAEQGNSYAQVNLGVYYLHRIKAQDAIGNSVLLDLLLENLKKAAYWFTKAAEQGDVRGQFNIANLYEKGAGVYQSTEQAKYWYAKAAEQGNAEAQERLKSLNEGSSFGCVFIFGFGIVIFVAVIRMCLG